MAEPDLSALRALRRPGRRVPRNGCYGEIGRAFCDLPVILAP